MTDTYQHAIWGLLKRRQELLDETAALRERAATIANDVEAIDRVLDTLGHQADLEGRTPRQARIILFYRNELRQFLEGQLVKAEAPMRTRELAEALCETEGRDYRDRRMLNDITKRLSKALRQMRHMGLVSSAADAKGTFRWWLAGME
jgi:hypothetical protein